MKKNDEERSARKKGNTGFYIALAVCIATIAAAAWTTYGSLADDMRYMSSESSVGDIAAGNDVSGQIYESSAEEESEPAESTDSDESSAEPQPAESIAEDSSVTSGDNGEKIFMPVNSGTILKGYSGDELVYSKTTADWRTHRGLDIKAESGTAVKAVSDGKVLSIEKNAKLGNVITIDHGDFKVRYCGLTESCLVREGSTVKGGAPIGYIGTVPCEQLDGAHLHLELVIGDTLTDPQEIILRAE